MSRLISFITPDSDSANTPRFTLAAVIVILLGTQLTWLLFHPHYPRADAGEFAQLAQNIYTIFREQGFAAGVSALFWSRTWKPILVGPLAVPALFLFGGKLIPSITFTNIFIYVAFLVALAKLLRRFLSEYATAIALLWIGGSWWVLEAGRELMSELPFLASATTALYFLIETDGFLRMAASLAAGIFLGLALMIRPVEGTLYLAYPIVLVLLSGLQRKHLCALDLVAMATSILAAIFYFFPGGDGIRTPLSVAGIFVSVGFLALRIWFAGRNGRVGSRAVMSFFLITYAMVVGWFAAFRKQLIEWIWTSSYGHNAQAWGGRDHAESTLSFAWHALEDIPGTVTVVTIFICFLFWLVMGMRKDSIKPKKKTVLLLFGLIVATGVPYFIGGTTDNMDHRYYYFGGVLMQASCVVLVLSLLPLLPKASTVRRLALALLVAAGLVQSTFAMGDAFFQPARFPRISEVIAKARAWLSQGEHVVFRGTVEDDRKTLTLYTELEKSLRLDPSHEKKIAAIPLIVNANGFPPIEFDAWLLSSLALQDGHHWQFAIPEGEPGSYDVRLAFLIRNFDWVVVGPLGGRGGSMFDQFSDLGEALVQRWVKGVDFPSTLRQMTTVRLNAEDALGGTYVLFKVVRGK